MLIVIAGYREEAIWAYILYRHVLAVVMLSLYYMAPIELDLVTKNIISRPEKDHLLIPIDCNCKL